jgi:hypothetical protein
MQIARHPNKLRDLLAIAGLTHREAAHEAGIADGTLRHYIKGDQVIPRRDRIKLAQVIGCDIQDLAPYYGATESKSNYRETNHMTDTIVQGPPPFGERDGCFSFGSQKTTWKYLDGDGVGEYQPRNIRTHYIAHAELLPEELQARKDRIQQEQEQKREQGQPFLWNGGIYSLDRFVIGREPLQENMTLDLLFRPSDYYTYLATNMSLGDPEIRQKYLQHVDWNETIPSFSHSFGISLAVVTADGYTLFTRRGKNVGSLPDTYETSVVEGLSRPLDRGATGEAPDVYRCACRGLYEELGLHESTDYQLTDITFLSFGVSTQYALWALRGMVRIKRSMHELATLWDSGVKDKFENQEILPVPFTLDDVTTFVLTHQSFSLKPTIYHALVHEFGKKHVDAVIAAYDKNYP